MNDATSIKSSAMLVELSLSVWTGRKMDKGVSAEVDRAKNTKTRAGAYHKRLMADSEELHRIEQYAGDTRTFHYRNTLPWSDGGARLLPMENFFEYKHELGEREKEFEKLVKAFIDGYTSQVSTMAFKLGDLFDRDEYPDVTAITDKFKFSYVFSPVPDAGDWRIDIGDQGLTELREEYERVSQDRIELATADIFDRLHLLLKHMVERLGDTNGKPNIFRDSLVDNVQEFIPLMERLNVAGDYRLTEIKEELASICNGLTPDELRKNQAVREEVRANVKDILDRLGM